MMIVALEMPYCPNLIRSEYRQEGIKCGKRGFLDTVDLNPHVEENYLKGSHLLLLREPDNPIQDIKLLAGLYLSSGIRERRFRSPYVVYPI
ncbi:hypothetical protein SAMN05661044_02146 [Olivibacter domesticus]|uniref:Uncharacterized protein n=1 Tax=Olivibacter domesticus TaxID=407022 RepID=A0A1H7MXC4_OLID1|nr:hypothetical protein SAMN05661044_02146 [Olivibacter domesticus]